jgi:hypothetical protein
LVGVLAWAGILETFAYVIKSVDLGSLPERPLSFTLTNRDTSFTLADRDTDFTLPSRDTSFVLKERKVLLND